MYLSIKNGIVGFLRVLTNPKRAFSNPALQSCRNSKGILVKTDKQNKLFEEFYRKQKICEDHEFNTFLDVCRSGLPTAFRVILSKPEATRILTKLRSGYFAAAGVEPVTWYPDNNTWKFNISRWELAEREDLKKYHKLLDNWRLTGNIYRMEQVSMVPVACLDIQPNHAVLDMCASPGSKTGQVLEAMQIRLFQGEIPSGFLIANEPDLKRCKVLAGNMKLFSSPCIMVTNFRGEDIPDMKQSDGQPLLFDRIICDVPCSGDGTIRKNPNVWNNWNPARGNERFSLQLNIARRGIHLLKEEGLMAYSSCSMNQIENEAVVAQLLEESEGCLELVDVRGRFKGLKFSPGLDHWRVHDKNMNEYKDYHFVPENLRGQIREEMFPHSGTRYLKLDRTMRFLPHHNDDGGFFVAIFRKIRYFENKYPRAQRKPAPTPLNSPICIQKTKNKFYSDFKDLDDFKSMFGIELDNTNLLTWSEDRKNARNVFFVNNVLKNFVRNNPSIDCAMLGTQIFCREGRKMRFKYKFLSGSIHLLGNLISHRKIEVSRTVFASLVSEPCPKPEALSPAVLEKIQGLEYGLVLFKLIDSMEMLLMPAFVSKNKIEVMLKKECKESLKLLLED